MKLVNEFQFNWHLKLNFKFTHIYLQQLLGAPYHNATYTIFNKLSYIMHLSYTRPGLSVSPKQVCHKNIQLCIICKIVFCQLLSRVVTSAFWPKYLFQYIMSDEPFCFFISRDIPLGISFRSCHTSQHLR